MKSAASELEANYDTNLIGKIMEGIYSFHNENNILYTYTTEAQTSFDKICDAQADQFNSRWNISTDDQFSQTPSSQQSTQMDTESRLDIEVRTKASELIGRLSAVLWIYCKG